MIDLHTHLLPGIDDGAATTSDTLCMVDLMLQQNIDTVVCTPHFYADKLSLTDFIKKRSESIASIPSLTLTILLGSETLLCDALFFYNDLTQLCIGGTSYLLLELPDHRKWGKKVFQQIDRLIKNYHVLPIIAHIERYPVVSIRKLRKLKQVGCLLQINSGSITDNRRSERTISYLRHGLVDVLASDCHNTQSRPPNLSEGYQWIDANLDAGITKRLMQNTSSIINGLIVNDSSEYLILK